MNDINGLQYKDFIFLSGGSNILILYPTHKNG